MNPLYTGNNENPQNIFESKKKTKNKSLKVAFD